MGQLGADTNEDGGDGSDGSSSSSGEDSEDEDSSSSDEEMAESDEAEEGEEKESTNKSIAPTAMDQMQKDEEGNASVVPPKSAVDLRKGIGGDETPALPEKAKPLYQVLQQTAVDGDDKQVFSSDVAYVMPPTGDEAVEVAASVLSKTPFNDTSSYGKRKHGDVNEKDGQDDDEGELGKKFKF